MSWIHKVLFISAALIFFSSAYFLGWLQNFKVLIVGVNSYFWVKLPFEFRVVILGFIIIIVLGAIKVATRD